MEPYCSWRANILLMSKWFNTCVFFLKTSGRIRHLRHLCAFFGGFKTCKTGSHVDGIEYRFNFPACKVQIGRCWKGCISMPLYKFQGELGYKEPELTMFDKANLILHQLHPWFHDENTWAKNHITILKLTEFKSFFENSFPNTHTHTHPGWGGVLVSFQLSGGFFGIGASFLEYQKSSFCDPSQSCQIWVNGDDYLYHIPFLISITFLFVCNLGFFL